MNESQFTALVRKEYPQYGGQSDEWIMEAIRRVIVERLPGIGKIYELVNNHKIPTGLLSGFFQKRLTKQQADTFEHEARAAKAANEMDMSLKSSMTGVPREHLGEADVPPSSVADRFRVLGDCTLFHQ